MKRWRKKTQIDSKEITSTFPAETDRDAVQMALIVWISSTVVMAAFFSISLSLSLQLDLIFYTLTDARDWTWESRSVLMQKEMN